MERLIVKSKENVGDVLDVMRKYKQESLSLCGKTYE